MDLYRKSTPPNLCMIKPEIAEAITGMTNDDLTKMANEGKTGKAFPAKLSMAMDKRVNQMATATAASSTNITPLITSKRWPNVQAWRWLFMESPAALPPDHQG